MALNLVLYAIDDGSCDNKLATTVSWIGRLFPTFGLSFSLMNFVETSFENAECATFPYKYEDKICSNNSDYYNWMDYRKCCGKLADTDIIFSKTIFNATFFAENCYELSGTTCFEAKNLLVWDRNETCYISSTYYYTESSEMKPGIIQALLYQTIMGIVYYLILIVIEKGLFRKLLAWTSKAEQFTFKINSTDNDVNTERVRVEQMVASGKCLIFQLIISSVYSNEFLVYLYNPFRTNIE